MVRISGKSTEKWKLYWKVKLGQMVVLCSAEYGPVTLMKRPVRTRLWGGLGEKITGYPIGIDMGHPNFLKGPILASKRGR